MVLQLLVAALIGYIIRLRWVIVMMIFYLALFLWVASNEPWIIEQYWRSDFLIFQGIGLFVGAFIRKPRDKKRIDRVSTVVTTEETEKEPETANSVPEAEISEPEDEDAFLV